MFNTQKQLMELFGKYGVTLDIATSVYKDIWNTLPQSIVSTDNYDEVIVQAAETYLKMHGYKPSGFDSREDFNWKNLIRDRMNLFCVPESDQIPMLNDVYDSAPAELKKQRSNPEVIFDHLPSYLKSQGYRIVIHKNRETMPDKLKIKYDSLVVGNEYYLKDYNTNTQITDDVNTFGDDEIYIVTDDSYVHQLSANKKVVNGARYILISRDPVLIFEGPIDIISERYNSNAIRSKITDINYLEDAIGRSLTAAELSYINNEWEWNMRTQQPFRLQDVFRKELNVSGTNMTPQGLLGHEKNVEFIVSLLTGNPSIAYWLIKGFSPYDVAGVLSVKDFRIYMGSSLITEVYFSYVNGLGV